MNRGIARGELGGFRALVVDDDDDICEAVAEVLEMCGMDVRTATSANEGFTAFREHRPAILISDIEMAGGSGMDLIRRIRALPAEQGGLTPAIAMSGRVTAQPCLEAGFHFHLSKPIEMLVLLDTVRDFIRSEKAGGAQWTVTLVPPNDIVVRFDGHVTAFDMRRAVDAVVELLACSPEKRRVIVDLTRLSGFDPSVGSAAQSVVWESRQRIRDVIIVGGTRLSHLVGRGVCMMLGLPCELRAATSA